MNPPDADFTAARETNAREPQIHTALIFLHGTRRGCKRAANQLRADASAARETDNNCHSAHRGTGLLLGFKLQENEAENSGGDRDDDDYNRFIAGLSGDIYYLIHFSSSFFVSYKYSIIFAAECQYKPRKVYEIARSFLTGRSEEKLI